jgi:SAM-dependent methyltransferase
MTDQASAWSQAAKAYEEDFIDPYRADVHSPLDTALAGIKKSGQKVAADLGCGIGPLLPTLAKQFGHVYAVDFARGMLERAQRNCAGLNNIEFRQHPLTDLSAFAAKVDVAVAVNSLVMPNVLELEQVLVQVRQMLRPGGMFLGIVPAMDAVHYFTMLLLDRALARGLPIEAARKNAAHLNEHGLYDFAFGQFRYKGLEQHFWQPFEVRYRLRRAGFHKVRLARVLLSWEQFACADDLKKHTAPWDWFFQAEPAKNRLAATR